ncbi:MAG: 16S rRNA (guanine(527)-N(7))-methyltransferase RsmG [Syntrophobacteraceae bacterium]|nr:16S rRNA (guanine(527)-N(7))-methyltransferase RsmG [Syntrophobacteraceae bacterium]
MFEEEFSALILHHANEARVELTTSQARLLSLHVRVMLEWNSRLNLTRITAPEEVIIKHILDSMIPAGCLPRSGPALDVGAGAGFPGIPLQIFHPDLQMVLLESSRKKANFLSAAAASLALEGLTVVHGSWQDFRQQKENAGKFELIVMRALKPEPKHLSRLASSVLAPGGFFARWEVVDPDAGPKDTLEMGGKVRANIEFHGDFEYSLPGVSRRRAVRLWKKT